MPEALAAATPPDFSSLLMLVRLSERVLLTVFFLVAASVIMLIYRHKIQDIDIDLSNQSGSLKTTASLAMPVFILLSLILYAFVVFSHPVSVNSSSVLTTANGDVLEQATQSTTAFLGYGSGEDEQRDFIRDLDAVVVASRQLRRLSGTLPSSTTESLQPELVRLGAAAGRLMVMRNELLFEQFGSLDCLPQPLDQLSLDASDGCADFNTYLSRE